MKQGPFARLLSALRSPLQPPAPPPPTGPDRSAPILGFAVDPKTMKVIPDPK